MAGFEGISWAPGQLTHTMKTKETRMLDARAGTFAVSRSIHYGLCLTFEGIRFFVKEADGKLFAVFLNLDHNLNRFREGISFNLSSEQQKLVPSTDEILQLFLEFLGHPDLRDFMAQMAETNAQGYLRPFTVDDDQSIGVTFPSNPVIRIVAARYTSYLGEPFHGVAIPYLVRVMGINGTGRLKLGGNYLLSVKAIQEAKRVVPGASSALFLDDRPYDELMTRKVTEWDSSCCLFALRNNTVVKIPESNLILPSVTIQGICRILKQAGITVDERDVTYGELLDWAKNGDVVTVASVGTAGILNRCSSLRLLDNDKNELALIESDPSHPLFDALGDARRVYWGIFTGDESVPDGMNLGIHELLEPNR